MSIDAVFGRINEIKNRIGDIDHRVQDIRAGKFGQALEHAASPKPAPVLPGVTHSAPTLGPTTAATGLPAPTTPLGLTGLGGLVGDAARKNALDPALLQAVMTTESNGNPQATSPVGAMGLMQLMPETAKDLGVVHPYDAKENLEGGAKYLGDLTRRFGVTNGVAAYNAGPGAVASHGGVPPYPETQHYVQKVLSLYNEFKK